MRFNILVPAVALALISQNAEAKPIYLDCTLPDVKNERQDKVEVTLNEEEGEASIINRWTGFVENNVPAIFTNNEVLVLVKISGDTSTEWTVGRSDLSFLYKYNTMGKTLIKLEGKCALATPVVRKF